MEDLIFLNLVSGQLSQNSFRKSNTTVTTVEDLLKSANGGSENLTASFDDIDRNHGDATTVYWFDYEGKTYGLSIPDDNNRALVDDENYPVEDINDIGLEMLLSI